MKIIVLISHNYSLQKTFTAGFAKLGFDAKIIPFENLQSNFKNLIEYKCSELPYTLKKFWDEPWTKEINKKYIEIIKNEKPDLLLVYNDQRLLPESIKEIKKICKVVFFLGDNPYYNFTNYFNLAILREADLIVSPDTGWIEQLNAIGIKNTIFSVFGFSEEINYKKEVTKNELNKYSCDLLFIGRTYKDSWGYKRSLFLSKFSSFNLKIYTQNSVHWEKWLKCFPELNEKITFIKKSLSFEEINTMYNCSKIYPVDANPGLINGVHIRIFDCIGSGILPVVEFRKDISRVFGEVEIPTIINYDNCKDIIHNYLFDDERRNFVIERLRKFVLANYSPEKAAKNILNAL